MKQLGYEQKDPTPIHIDNMSTLQIINNNTSPTERAQHLDIRYYAIQDWRKAGDIIMEHIPGILNPSDDMTKSRLVMSYMQDIVDKLWVIIHDQISI